MKNPKRLRLILGDQLNEQHSWFEQTDDNCIYFMAEMRQETDYVKHHIQKICAFFLAMRRFRERMEKRGHHFLYFKIDDKNNLQELQKNINAVVNAYNIEVFEYQEADEYRLNQILLAIKKQLSIPVRANSSEHFLSKLEDFNRVFKSKKKYTMEFFYRHMRKKYRLLVDDQEKPLYNRWNFDTENRKSWNGNPPLPPSLNFNHNVTQILESIRNQGIKSIGNCTNDTITWPIDREEALQLLDDFCRHRLQYFGTYQDAMHTESAFLFHSMLSFSLNTKMLHPLEVVKKVIGYWEAHLEIITYAQIEGFVRQIIGWREYLRCIYLKEMPTYAQQNQLENQRTLPQFYWTGKTKMACMSDCIQKSLNNAYAHHIQRLMITGNFALLNMTHPNEVDRWYLGIYIDAIEWVEITNTRGMSQFADGGLLATKPYVSSGNYINKMSNYCKSCPYNVKKITEEDACPFN
ncbi:MAG: cryptochrome/photolyase family protein, partial [Flavobacteriaceae bacterium]|nr:cryptochrome/photolyase family protein [Flavobacteriaceae bacterium]